ncbi:hypothetical protein NHX12_007547, partial [Muraenolepis orangiensis]
MEAPPPRVKAEKIWSNEIPQRAEPAEPDQSLVTNCSQEMESLRLHLQALQRQLQQVNSSILHLEHNLTTLSLLPDEGTGVAHQVYKVFQELLSREKLENQDLLDQEEPK